MRVGHDIRVLKVRRYMHRVVLNSLFSTYSDSDVVYCLSGSGCKADAESCILKGVSPHRHYRRIPIIPSLEADQRSAGLTQPHLN